MAQPARTSRRARQTAPVDPHAVERAYRLEKRKRRARLERKRERRHAHLRFYVVIAALIVLTAVVVVTVLREVERLFGV
jgi:hypothetical protein